MRSRIMITMIQRQRIRSATRHQYFIPCHPTADLGQTHIVARHASGIDSIGHCQIRIIGHDLGRLSQCLFEWICGIITGF